MATRKVPITGSRPEMRPLPNVLTNAADTSRDAERLISRPPAPFSNPYGIANVPTGRMDSASQGVPYGRGVSVNARPQNVGKHVGVCNTSLSADEMAAIGYSENATKSNNPIISGFPNSRGSRRRR